jgi:purine-binding chemotaxis protein CheW
METCRQFISFTLGAEDYGVDILDIREIRGWSATTDLPDAPAFVRGVIDLRGAMVPILDLRIRFGNTPTPIADRPVVIVVSLGDQTVGILADTVSDILSVDPKDVRPVPPLAQTTGAGFVSGLVAVDGRLVALLDLAAIFSFDLSRGGSAPEAA